MLALVCPRDIPEKAWRAQAQARAERNGVPADQTLVGESWNRILAKLSSFRGLEDDWDGQGGCAPSRELLESANALAALLRERGMQAPSAVAPAPAGTILFIWQEQGGSYCEVEIERPFHAEVMFIEAGGNPLHWVLPDGN